MTDLLIPLAKKLDFTISPFQASAEKSTRHITLGFFHDRALEPAPITSGDTKAFALMAGTAKHIFGEETIVAPSGMYGQSAVILPRY
jgi:Gly-Xaa carboxypeptidase